MRGISIILLLLSLTVHSQWPVSPYLGVEQSVDSKIIVGLSRGTLYGTKYDFRGVHLKEWNSAVNVIIPTTWRGWGLEGTVCFRKLKTSKFSQFGKQEHKWRFNSGRLTFGMGATSYWQLDHPNRGLFLKPQVGFTLPRVDIYRSNKRNRYVFKMTLGYQLKIYNDTPEGLDSSPFFIRMVIHQPISKGRYGIVHVK